MRSSVQAGIEAIATYDEIIDVRSPAEYAEDHIPGAASCPVLNDEERALVGTIYTQQSPFEARKIGAALVAANIAHHLREHLRDKAKNWRPLVYCWRGGQRSGAMTTVLRQIGWDAAQLEGGYKTYRQHVLAELAGIPGELSLTVIGGSTGTGKTRLLHAMQKKGQQIIDLEALAEHKGSVLGLVPATLQPTQRMFDSLLLVRLRALDPTRRVFIEAESRKIGRISLPDALIDRMRQAPFITIEAPLAARVDFLLRDYDYFTHEGSALSQRLTKLRPLRGNETVSHWCDLIARGDWREFVTGILRDHYDPLYRRSLQSNYAEEKRSNSLATDSLDEVAIESMADRLLLVMTDR